MKWLQELFQPKQGPFGPEGALRPGKAGHWEEYQIPGTNAFGRRWVRDGGMPAEMPPTTVSTRGPMPTPAPTPQTHPDAGNGHDFNGAPPYQPRVGDPGLQGTPQSTWGGPGPSPAPYTPDSAGQPVQQVPPWVIMQQLLQGRGVWPFSDPGGSSWG